MVDADQADYTNPAGAQIPGYRRQSQENLENVASLKRTEEHILRMLDDLATLPDIDKRWLAIGRTGIEKSFMAVVRAIMQPQRVRLPGDV